MRLVMIVVLWSQAAFADEPYVGTTLHVGQALGSEAETRVGDSIWVLVPLRGGWLLGGEVGGTVEGWMGGYGCGTATGAVVPAIAVYCLEPSLGAHVLAGVQADPSSGSTLRLEGGVGAAARWLVAGDEAVRREIEPSGLLRASYMIRVVDTPTLEAVWWLGVALEERAVGLDDTRLARSAGLVLEARSY